MTLLLPYRRPLLGSSFCRNELWKRARAVPSLDQRFADDKSLRDAVSGQQLITFTRASSGTYVSSDKVLKTATTNEARFAHNPTTGESLGLLVEESRTNSIRNNTMVGAVAGTPGTLPTNWIGAGSSGLAREVVGTGTESGIAYVDVRYFGTTTSALYQNVSFEVTNQIAAAQSSIWTSTAFVKLVGGSLANITSVKLVIDSYNSSSVSLGQYAIGNFVPTTAALATQRYSVSSTSSTFSNAATAFVRPYLQFEANSGVAIDITLRIGMPQLEQGAFATSVIPTSTAAATRSADVASISGSNFSSWYRQDEGTVFAQYNSTTWNADTNFPKPFVIGIDDSNGFWIGGDTTDNAYRYRVRNGGTNQFGVATITRTPTTNNKTAMAVKASDFAVAADGGNLATGTTGSVPTATSMSIGVDIALNVNFINQPLRRLTYWPQRLSNSTLQSITQ